MAFSIPISVQTLMTGIVQSVWENSPGLLAPVTIHKEPLQIIVSSPQNLLFGYGDASTSNQEISYTQVNQTFSGQIIYPQKPRGSSTSYFDNKVALDPNAVYLRAKQDVFDYIHDGRKIEKIEADDKTWNYQGKTQIQNFLNLKFFYFEIKATN